MADCLIGSTPDFYSHKTLHQGELMNRICKIFISAALISPFARAVTPGQVDTFENGTTENWMINLLGMQPPPVAALPVNIPTGGPAGAGDNYLQLSSVGGNGPGG